MADFLKILKRDEAQRYTLGVVYEPDVVDTDGDFAKAEDIESASRRFMGALQKRTAAQKKACDIVGAFTKALETEPIRVDVTDVWDDLKKIGDGLGDMHADWSEDLGTIVDNYIAPVDFTLGKEKVTKGTWLLGVVWSPDYFQKILSGERTGFSMGGQGRKELVHA